MNIKEIIKEVEKIQNMCKELLSENEKCVKLSELMPGDRFDTELGNFIVLEHDMDNGWTKVIQDDFFAENARFDDSSCDYTKSNLKKMFDGEITEKYQKVFGVDLVEHEVDLVSVDMQKYGSFLCKVRPITFDETRKYNELLVKKGLPGLWWTCTPWSTEERGWKYSVAVVSLVWRYQQQLLH